MYTVLSTATILMVITWIMMSLASLLAKKSVTDREKCSPFECGFDPQSSSRVPFSLQFFLIAVIFLIFDVEIALLLPLVVTAASVNINVWFFTGLFFLVILLAGLYHEWNQGALGWTQ